jgi:phosphatidylserine/phosphatidylglycerophosphate/cardiolipin synthase-like enzyme
MKAYLRAGEPELVYSGSDYFDRLVALINGAQHTLHLQTYIFESDETGWHTIEALKQAASRQVKVYVLVDAFGSQGFTVEVFTSDFLLPYFLVKACHLAGACTTN